MIGFCPLASGSKGNCIYFGTDKTKLLIDAGISAKKIEQKLAEIQVDISKIDAVLITHEHMDHILGIKVLAEKYKIPVLVNSETAKGIYHALKIDVGFKIFTTFEMFSFQDLDIFPFTIQHDTLDPVAFTIQTPDIKFGICTDLGHVTTIVENSLQGCDYLYLEANHHPPMVHACLRPAVYKQRVLGRQGHLSNEDCAKLVMKLHHKDLKAVFLAHLSSECNSKELALKMVEDHLLEKKVPLYIAHQEKVSTPIYFS